MPNPMMSSSRFQPDGPQTHGRSSFPGGPEGSAGLDQAYSTAGTFVPVQTATSDVMTLRGTAGIAGILLAAIIAAGAFGWSLVNVTVVPREVGGDLVSTSAPAWWPLAAIGAMALAIGGAFKPRITPFTALPYALLEGITLGVISHLYNVQTEGIALKASVATIGVTAAMLFIYGTGLVKVTPRLTRGIVAATFGVLAIYLVGFVARLFGADLGIFSSSSPLSILFSVVVVGIAAFNLLLDFNFIERGVAERYPRYMQWFAAVGLMVTLVWIYLELLRLFAKLNRR